MVYCHSNTKHFCWGYFYRLSRTNVKMDYECDDKTLHRDYVSHSMKWLQRHDSWLEFELSLWFLVLYVEWLKQTNLVIWVIGILMSIDFVQRWHLFKWYFKSCPLFTVLLFLSVVTARLLLPLNCYRICPL